MVWLGKVLTSDQLAGPFWHPVYVAILPVLLRLARKSEVSSAAVQGGKEGHKKIKLVLLKHLLL